MTNEFNLKKYVLSLVYVNYASKQY